MPKIGFLLVFITSGIVAMNATVLAADIGNASDKNVTILLEIQDHRLELLLPPFTVIRDVCDECTLIINPESEDRDETSLMENDLAIIMDGAIELLTDLHLDPKVPPSLEIRHQDRKSTFFRILSVSRN